MKKLLFFGLLLITYQILLAQVPETEWRKTFGGSGSEGSTQGVENTDGDYYFACSSTSPPSEERTAPKKGSRDMWVVKTDKAGNKIWDKAYGGGLITVTGMAATNDGGIIIGANTQTSGTGIGYDKTDTTRGGIDIWLIKIDKNGNKVWDKTLGGSDFDGLGEIVEAPDGSILVIGYSSSPISGDRKSDFFGGGNDAWVVKLSAQGQYIWDRAYGGTGSEQFLTGLVDKNGNYVFGGISNSPISGSKSEPSRGGEDGWLVKTDLNGNVIWDKTLGGDLTDFIQSMAETSDGDYVLGIVSNSNKTGDKTDEKRGGDDCWLVKVNTSGNILWQRTIGGSKSDVIMSVQIDRKDGIYLAFTTQSDISGEKTVPFEGPSYDIWLVKTNNSGIIEWQSSYDFSGMGVATLTSDDSYLIAGERNAIHAIKLKNVITTSIQNNLKDQVVSLFPNPVKDQIKIYTKDVRMLDCVIEIYNTEGQLLLQKQKNFNNGVLDINFNLKNGIYLIKVQSDLHIFLEKFYVIN
jgi:hypothetical protein